jgi:hypothetical protein
MEYEISLKSVMKLGVEANALTWAGLIAGAKSFNRTSP